MTINFLTMGATEYNKFYDWVEENYPDLHSEWEADVSGYIELHDWLSHECCIVLDEYQEYLTAGVAQS